MNFGTILVSVDGSELSDRILVQARRLLVSQDRAVVLLRVIAPRGATEAPGAHQERLDAARAHLERLRAGLCAGGLTVTPLLEVGDPAQVILDVLQRERIGLVVMSTHGRTGLARWVRGSVAERVLRGAGVPVFLANPRALGDAPSSGELRFERILVPLDGSPHAAEVLPAVVELARAFEAPVTLLRVGLTMPANADVLLPYVCETPRELAAALEGPRGLLAEAGVEAKVAVTYGQPTTEILAEAERVPGTLLVMATHGRSGSDRWIYGSTAEAVLRLCPCPLLVQRVAGFQGERPARAPERVAVSQ